MPAAVSRACTAIGDGTCRTPADDPCQVPGAAFQVRDLQRRDALGRLRILRARRCRGRERDPGRRRDLPGDPEHREEVGTVRRDLDVEDRVVQPERPSPRPSPARGRSASTQDPSCVAEIPSSSGAQSMPFETTPRISRAASGSGASGTRAPGGASGTRSPGAMFRTPTTTSSSPDPVCTRARQSLSRVRVVADLDHPRDDDAGDPLPRTLDRLDLRALAREQLRELLGRQVGRAQLAQPGQDDLHAAPSNRSRNRTSPSTNSRMSFTPYLTIATRSIPMPNAKPVYRSESYAAVLEHLRMDHPGAEQLEPSVAAHAAPHAAADEARHRDLAPGLDEREVVGREPHARVARRTSRARTPPASR